MMRATRNGTRVGDRVELVRSTDPYTKLEPGTQGVVDLIDDAGTAHVTWDNGARLGLVAEAGDVWKIVSRASQP